jgi:hypothetical protein
MLGLCFTNTITDLNFYFLFEKPDLLILILYVDDLMLIGSSKKFIARCNTKITHEYEMKNIGLVHYFLGLEVWQSICDVFLG